MAVKVTPVIFSEAWLPLGGKRSVAEKMTIVIILSNFSRGSGVRVLHQLIDGFRDRDPRVRGIPEVAGLLSGMAQGWPVAKQSRK